MKRFFAVFFVMFSLAGWHHAAAQEATPQPGIDECTVEPGSIDAIVALFFDPSGSPIAQPSTETQSVSADSELPQGQSADAATVAAIDTTLREWNTCFALGQYLRGFSLMTPNAARLYGPDTTSVEQDTPAEVKKLLEDQLNGTPIPGEEPGVPVILDGPTDARILPDGRAGAIWGYEGDRAFVVFARQGDQWLVDDFIDIVESGTPSA